MTEFDRVPTAELVGSFIETEKVKSKQYRELTFALESLLAVIAENSEYVLDEGDCSYIEPLEDEDGAIIDEYRIVTPVLDIENSDKVFTLAVKTEVARYNDLEDAEDEFTSPQFISAIKNSREVELLIYSEELTKIHESAELTIRKVGVYGNARAYYEDGGLATVEHVELVTRLLNMGATALSATNE